MSKKKTSKPAPAAATTAVPSATTPWGWIIGGALFIIVLTWMAYSKAPQNGFVDWDDPTYVAENPLFNPLTPAKAAQINEVIVSNNYHPLTMWSLMRQVENNGIKAGPMIQLNVLLHILGSLLVFWFVGLLTRGRWWVALATALLFAVHPMHVESVAWVSERKDVLYVMFGMASMVTWLLYVRSDGKNWGWWALTGGLLTLSCLSKAMAVVFPVLYLLVDYWEGRSLKSGRVWLEKAPYWAISLLFGLIAMDVQRSGTFHGWFTRLEVANSIATALPMDSQIQFAGYGLGQYLIQFFVPWRMSAFHPYPTDLNGQQWPFVTGILMLAGYFAVMIWLALRSGATFQRYQKPLLIGMIWGIVSLILVLQFISVGSAYMADRYAYLPYVGWGFALSYAAFEWAGEARRWIVLGVFGAISVFFAFKSAQEVAVWKDSVALWSRVIEHYPNNSSAYARRGTAWGKERKDPAKSKADFERAIQINPREDRAYEGLGILAGMQNDHATALQMFTKCIEINPKHHNYYFNRAVAYLQSKQPQPAIQDLLKVTELNPGKRDFFANYLLDAYAMASQWNDAAQLAQAMIQRGAASANTWVSLGQAQLNLQQRDLARQSVQKALTIDGNNALAKQLMAALGQ
jgi:protein O-mannosyl-transferase